MKTRRMQIILAAVSIAAGGSACSSSSNQGGTGGAAGSGGTTGAAGAGGTPAGTGGSGGCTSASASVSCTPDLAWYAIAGSVDAGAGATVPISPAPTTGGFCTSAGLAVDFNAAGNSGATKGIWDARSYGGVAFDFSGTNIPMHGVRVSFVFAGQGPDGPPWYQGTAQAYSALADGDHVVIHWDAIGGPYGATNPPLFDPSKLQTMQIQVLEGTVGTTPYQFCVTNLAPLPD
jgi:hypothetical protein